jgi:aminoglycoside 3-N-acetyltransferase
MRKKTGKCDYTEEDIVIALKNIGLKNGDNIFVYSNMGFFGILKDASTEDYYEAFKRAIFKVIGEDGTLVVPTFSYSFCQNEVFNPESTSHKCGMFSEMVRQDSESIRSIDANFSIAAIGKKSRYFTDRSPEHSFGENCFWERFLDSNGIFVNFNFDSGSTFVHYVEKKLNVPYRYDKAFQGTLVINGKKQQAVFYHFVYDLEKPNNFPDFTKFDKKAKSLGLAKTANLGRGQIVSITARTTLGIIESQLKIDPAFLIKGNTPL